MMNNLRVLVILDFFNSPNVPYFSGFSYDYVKSYAKKSKKSFERACLAVINTVGKVLDEILYTHLQVKEEVA